MRVVFYIQTSVSPEIYQLKPGELTLQFLFWYDWID